ncbi:leucyl aminopeptidase family protein [Roseospirillum parvum]|uniref:Leucyl aminopeptidase n=1 Tax=Roseospirillum parvum TaxID=83401 RepID=A0A1G7ZSF1_9PROT|nr:leucyl aminopeptidase family protein [Roseospirillum parvum]SDH11040.1 leucyl aminopeptidase [Roseospirillum parvum]
MTAHPAFLETLTRRLGALPLSEAEDAPPLPLSGVATDELGRWLIGQTPRQRTWIEANGFTAEAGQLLALPDGEGRLAGRLFGLGEGDDPWLLAALPGRLGGGLHALDPDTERRLGARFGSTGAGATWSAIAWALGSYRPAAAEGTGGGGAAPRLVWPAAADRGRVCRVLRAATLVRDLVNLPAEELGPAELTAVARAVLEPLGVGVHETVGDDLLAAGYPAIHAVGRASSRPPRLLDLAWGDPRHPHLTLVGKGVCFDTGGLNLKPAAGMRWMKKDMGGAAHALGLALMIVEAGLPVRLRVLIPAVDNAVAGNALRPGDVVPTRAGKTVEIGNTDAEGRVILADALAEAAADDPHLLIDLATLTGAARVALGPEVVPFYTPDDDLAEALAGHARATHDPLWRMPLWPGYRKLLDSRSADLTNAPDSPFAGSLTAALFLAEFVGPKTPWLHLDLFAWSPCARPGYPEGGADQGLRALADLIQSRYG